MNKRDLAYKLYEAGVIAFDDYQCVDCGGNNVLVDSFYACAVEIKAEAGRAGFIACAAEFGFYLTSHQANIVNEAADQYAERVRSGEK